MTSPQGGAPAKVRRVWLRYESRRGAGVMLRLSADAAIAKIKTLRCPAVLETDDGEQVGGVEETDGADDQRVRWNWWFDATKLQAKALP